MANNSSNNNITASASGPLALIVNRESYRWKDTAWPISSTSERLGFLQCSVLLSLSTLSPLSFFILSLALSLLFHSLSRSLSLFLSFFLSVFLPLSLSFSLLLSFHLSLFFSFSPFFSLSRLSLSLFLTTVTFQFTDAQSIWERARGSHVVCIGGSFIGEILNLYSIFSLTSTSQKPS